MELMSGAGRIAQCQEEHFSPENTEKMALGSNKGGNATCSVPSLILHSLHWPINGFKKLP